MRRDEEDEDEEENKEDDKWWERRRVRKKKRAKIKGIDEGKYIYKAASVSLILPVPSLHELIQPLLECVYSIGTHDTAAKRVLFIYHTIRKPILAYVFDESQCICLKTIDTCHGLLFLQALSQ